MEILTAYLREKWPYQKEEEQVSPNNIFSDPFPADKNAVLIVLGQRSDAERCKDIEYERYLDLRYLDLSSSGMDRRTLNRSDMSCTSLLGAHLEETSLMDSYFFDSILDRGKLVKATLIDTHFDNSSCIGTDFSHSGVLRASFDGANLNGANFTGTKNLTKEQLLKASSINNAILPNDLGEIFLS